CNLVANQITEHRRIARISVDCVSHHLRNFATHSFLPEKFDVLFPRQRDQNANAGRETFFQKPIWRRMINTKHIDPNLPHHAKIDIDGLGLSKSISFFIRLKRTVSRALDKKLAIPFEEEFRNRPDPYCHRYAHSERNTFPAIFAVFSMSPEVWAVEMKPVSN